MPKVVRNKSWIFLTIFDHLYLTKLHQLTCFSAILLRPSIDVLIDITVQKLRIKTSMLIYRQEGHFVLFGQLSEQLVFCFVVCQYTSPLYFFTMQKTQKILGDVSKSKAPTRNVRELCCSGSQMAFQKIPIMTVEPPKSASAIPEYSRPLIAVARARSLPADVLSFVREMMKNSRLVNVQMPVAATPRPLNF